MSAPMLPDGQAMPLNEMDEVFAGVFPTVELSTGECFTLMPQDGQDSTNWKDRVWDLVEDWLCARGDRSTTILDIGFLHPQVASLNWRVGICPVRLDADQGLIPIPWETVHPS